MTIASNHEKVDIDYIWKILVCGEGGVGKTTILHRYIHNEFVENMKLTIGCQFHTQLLERQGLNINLVLWDFSGQDRFRFFFADYARGAAAAFIMFDMSQPGTLEKIDDWITLIKKNSPEGIPLVLVGGKYDLVPPERVEEVNALAKKLAEEKGLLSYHPTSSKINFNVDETILYMVDLLIYKNVKE